VSIKSGGGVLILREFPFLTHKPFQEQGGGGANRYPTRQPQEEVRQLREEDEFLEEEP
jgi:hypothetical protein